MSIVRVTVEIQKRYKHVPHVPYTPQLPRPDICVQVHTATFEWMAPAPKSWALEISPYAKDRGKGEDWITIYAHHYNDCDRVGTGRKSLKRVGKGFPKTTARPSPTSSTPRPSTLCTIRTNKFRICGDSMTQNACDNYCGHHGSGFVDAIKPNICMNEIASDKSQRKGYSYIQDWNGCKLATKYEYVYKVKQPISRTVNENGDSLTMRCFCKPPKDAGRVV